MTRTGDTVSWVGTTGTRWVGVLVGHRGERFVVRRWVASRRKFGKPQVIAQCESASDTEWLSTLRDE